MTLDTGATFSSCQTYRYALWRIWEPSAPTILFIGLNPSTADAKQNDPTIRRCISFAKRWGYGVMYVANLFSLRTPHPKHLKAAPDPIGYETDYWLTHLSHNADCVIACWGNHGSFCHRDQVITAMIANLYCLAITKQGQPAHPLYLPNTLIPIPFTHASNSCHISITPDNKSGLSIDD